MNIIGGIMLTVQHPGRSGGTVGKKTPPLDRSGGGHCSGGQNRPSYPPPPLLQKAKAASKKNLPNLSNLLKPDSGFGFVEGVE